MYVKCDLDRFFKGNVDLAIEAPYLAMIEHPKTIEMQATLKVFTLYWTESTTR